MLALALNEREGVAAVLPRIDRSRFAQIIVVDGGSSDGTADPAERSRTMWNRWRASPADFTSGEELTLRDLRLVLELRAIR